MEENKNPKNQMPEKGTPERPLHRDVPLHRSYGVTRRESWLDTFLHIFFLSVMTLLLAVFGGIVVFVIVMMFCYAPDSIRFPAGALLIVLVLWIPGRVLWKRFRFVGKLKRFCKQNRYRLTRLRGFFASLRHSDKKADFMIATGKHTYYVCYLTTVRHHSHLIFSAPDEITRVTNVGNNKFAAIYGRQNHMKKCPFVYPPVAHSSYGKPTLVILCNPAPDAMYRIQADGSRVTSGTGDVAFGKQIYVGTGFLHAVERKERE